MGMECEPPSKSDFDDKFASKELPFSELKNLYSDKLKDTNRYEEELEKNKPTQEGDFICTIKKGNYIQ